MTWDAPARATQYDVTYTPHQTVVGIKVVGTGRAAWNRAGTSLTITCDIREGQENGNCVGGSADYQVAVRARNAAGESAWTSAAWASYRPPR